MAYRITVLPPQVDIFCHGGDLLSALRSAGLAPDAPCGGEGHCGKCTVILDDREVSACRTTVDRDMTVTIPQASDTQILTESCHTFASSSSGDGYALAFDIGTTTVAGYLLAADGTQLVSDSRLNPQKVYGADVISRIRHALDGNLRSLTGCIRSCVLEMALDLCRRAHVAPENINTVSVVGNPAMQQLFLGIVPKNLARIPFAPVLTQSESVPAVDYLPDFSNARLLIVPDISGFVGADTVAGILATAMDRQDPITLLVDIGTNGEMVLGNRHRLVACSTAAGPALEGANISCGMRGQTGAVDHVWLEEGTMLHSVIGSTEATGICGSGLIDAVAAALDLGLLNSRGRILTPDRTIAITPQVRLTQEDIRQVQLAKGAIAAGIRLLARQLDISLEDIHRVYLAGAFGTYMDPAAACRMGLLPRELEGKIEAVGNAAGSGAKLLACNPGILPDVQQLVTRTEFLELASAPGFQRLFAESMRFSND